MILGTLADVVPMADSWYGLSALVVVTVGGWVTIWLKQRGNSQKMTAQGRRLTSVGNQVADVQSSVNDVNEQVSNNHQSNLRDDITEVLRMTSVTKDAVEKLQDIDIRLIRQDISRISGDIQVLRAELTTERDARTDLEQRFDDRESQ